MVARDLERPRAASCTYALACIALVDWRVLGAVEPSATVELDREDSGKTIEAALGQEIEITLQTIGPGRYGTPSISSRALRFIDVVFGAPVPGGPTQIFRFSTEETGSAMITITHTESNPDFTADIVVR